MLRFWLGSERQRQKNEKRSIGLCYLGPQTGITGKATQPISLAWLKVSLLAYRCFLGQTISLTL